MSDARRKIRTIICVGCGQTVTKRMRKGLKFCNRACFLTNAAKGKTRRNGKDVPCEWCGKTVYKQKSALALHTNHFCSTEHQNAWQSRNRIHGKCDVCGKAFDRSPSHKKRGSNKFCSNACRYASDDFAAQVVEMNAQQQAMKPNKLEIAAYKILDTLGIDYKAQYIVNGKICVDSFFPSSNLIVQFDGDYWHGHPERFPNPDERQKKRMTFDMSQDAYLTKCGYKILRFWESDIRNNPEQFKQAVAAEVST